MISSFSCTLPSCFIKFVLNVLYLVVMLFVEMVVQIKSDMELDHTQNTVYSKEEH